MENCDLSFWHLLSSLINMLLLLENLLTSLKMVKKKICFFQCALLHLEDKQEDEKVCRNIKSNILFSRAVEGFPSVLTP